MRKLHETERRRAAELHAKAVAAPSTVGMPKWPGEGGGGKEEWRGEGGRGGRGVGEASCPRD